jgi:hypothetical protein
VKIDGLLLTAESKLTNLRIESGGSFPTVPNQGRMFYLDSNDSNEGMYYYDDTDWVSTSSGGGGSKVTTAVDVSVTVGATGDYPTINAALEYLSTIFPEYKSEGITASITLQSGFVVSEQIVANGIDLSWIEITGVDAETAVNTSAITTAVGIQAAVFNATNGGKLPTISQLFVGDEVATVTGILSEGADSISRVTNGAGFKNFQYGAIAHELGTVNAPYGVFTGCYGGCYAYRSGVVVAPYVDCSQCNRGLYAHTGGIISAYDANCSNAGFAAIFATDSSIIQARFANCSNSSSYGVYATSSSVVLADNASCYSAGSYAVNASTASIVSVSGGSAYSCGSRGIVSFWGSAVMARGVNARVNTSADGPNDFYVGVGGVIQCSQSTGGTSIAINSLSSANGLILK